MSSQFMYEGNPLDVVTISELNELLDEDKIEFVGQTKNLGNLATIQIYKYKDSNVHLMTVAL